jgi:hypothetical protein
MSTVKAIKNVKVEQIKDSFEDNLKYIDNNDTDNCGNKIESLNLVINDEEVVNVSLSGANVDFEIRSTTFCCGLLELGELNCNSSVSPLELSKLLDYCVGRANGKTLMINTNGVSYSVIFEKALVKSKYFKLVKTFKNGNSGNTVKIWISNND